MSSRKPAVIYIAALVLAAHLGICLPQISRSIFAALRSADLAHREAREETSDFTATISSIKENTPEDSIIMLPMRHLPNAPDLNNSGYCDYFLFPRYPLRENETFKKSLAPAGSPAYKICDDLRLSLVKERAGSARPHIENYRDIPTDAQRLFLSLIKILLMILSGSLLVEACLDERSLPGFLSSSFLAGTTLSTLLYIVLNTAGLDFTEPLQFGLLAAFSIPAVVRFRRYREAHFDHAHIPRAAGLALIPVIIFFCASTLVSVLMSPAMAGDGCAIWAPKAQSIFALHNMSGLRIWGAYPSYPPLVPIAMSQLAIGGEGIAKLVFPIFAFCLYAAVYAELAETGYPQWLKISLPAALLATPIFFMHSFVGYANLALTAFVSKAAFMLPKLIKDPARNTRFGFSLLLCGIILVRPDGIFWASCLAAAAVLFTDRSAGGARRFAYLLAPLCCWLLWNAYAFLIMKRPPPDIHFFAPGSVFSVADWGRLRAVSLNLLSHSISPRIWGMISISFLFMLILKGRALAREYTPLLFVVAAGASGIIALSYFLPVVRIESVQWYFECTFERLLMTVAPVAFVITVKAIARPNVLYLLKPTAHTNE